MKFKNKKTSIVVEANTLHDIKIVQNNPNYTELKDKKEKHQNTTEEVGDKLS